MARHPKPVVVHESADTQAHRARIASARAHVAHLKQVGVEPTVLVEAVEQLQAVIAAAPAEALVPLPPPPPPPDPESEVPTVAEGAVTESE